MSKPTEEAIAEEPAGGWPARTVMLRQQPLAVTTALGRGSSTILFQSARQRCALPQGDPREHGLRCSSRYHVRQEERGQLTPVPCVPYPICLSGCRLVQIGRRRHSRSQGCSRPTTRRLMRCDGGRCSCT